MVKVYSKNSAVWVDSEMYSNIKMENIETGRHFKDKHFLFIIDAGNWYITLGSPIYHFILI